MTPIAVSIIGLVVALGVVFWASRAMTDSVLLTVTVLLGVCAAVWNVLVPLPNVEATSLVVICVAISLGIRPAVMTGVVATVLSSIAGGLGVWTSWQIVGVVVLAVAGGYWARRCASRLHLSLACGLTAGLVDVVITVPTVASTMQLQADLVPGLVLVGLPYTAFHVVAVAALTYALAPSLTHSLDRAAQRLRQSM